MHENGRALNVYQHKYPMWLPQGNSKHHSPFQFRRLWPC
ncbi:unnamed protein product [Brassica oleracea]